MPRLPQKLKLVLVIRPAISLSTVEVSLVRPLQNVKGNVLGVHRHRMRGVGLIEVLVTLIILSTALLTLTALQTRSLQFNHSAYLRSQANNFAYDILDRDRKSTRLNSSH